MLSATTNTSCIESAATGVYMYDCMYDCSDMIQTTLHYDVLEIAYSHETPRNSRQ